MLLCWYRSGIRVRAKWRVCTWYLSCHSCDCHTDVPNYEFSQHIQRSLRNLPKNFKKVKGQIWRHEFSLLLKTLGLLYSVAPSTLLATVRCQPLRCPVTAHSVRANAPSHATRKTKLSYLVISLSILLLDHFVIFNGFTDRTLKFLAFFFGYPVLAATICT